MVGTLTLHLHIPACASLKEKRRRIKPLLSRLRREFNISAAEMDFQDEWQDAFIGCAMISNGRAHLESGLQAVAKWVEANWPDGMIVKETIEVI